MRTSALVIFGLCFAAGCSSASSDPFGATPDFGQVQTRFSAPTGTFAAASTSQVLAGFSEQKSALANDGFGIGGTSSSNASSGSGSGTTTKSLKFLDANGGTSFCPALESGAQSGSCACPNGGTLEYDLTGMQQIDNYHGGAVDVTLKVRAEACTLSGASLDGTEFAKIASTGTPGQQNLLMLFDLHMTATQGGHAVRIDEDYEFWDGKFWYAVTALDGTVVVSADDSWDGTTKTGTVYVKDRTTTWTCTFTTGKATCTSDTGTSQTVASN